MNAVSENDRATIEKLPGDSAEAGWKKQAVQALVVWSLTYVSAIIILMIINAEHVFAVALLPTLSSIFSNRGIFKAIFKRRTD